MIALHIAFLWLLFAWFIEKWYSYPTKWEKPPEIKLNEHWEENIEPAINRIDE